MSVFSSIWEGLKKLYSKIANFVKRVFRAIVNFAKDVVDYFKRLNLNPKQDTPFVIDAGELGQRIKEAKKVNVGIFQGVYHEDTNTITDCREIEADNLDNQTQEVMKQGEDGIVVLE